MMAKRRSYATLQSYLTPPFLESSVRGIYRELMEKIKIYNNSQKANKDQESLAVKTLTVKMGIHRDLGLDSMANKPYTEDEIARVENFAEVFLLLTSNAAKLQNLPKNTEVSLPSNISCLPAFS